MSRMFGDRIYEFVLSIDIMGDETFHDLLDLVQRYVAAHLGISYFSVLDQTTVNNNPGLQTIWSTRDEKPSYTVDREAGYVSHTAYVFGENKPIWVLGAELSSLSEGDGFTDEWSASDDLPPYNACGPATLQTSVMHPLRRDGRAIGVVEFGSTNRIEPTPASLREVTTLASVISSGYQMYDRRLEQRSNNRQAIRRLTDALENENWTRLALPQLFFAYAGLDRVDKSQRDNHAAVITAIREVLDSYRSMLHLVIWEDSTEAGNINEQVIRDIGLSEFGLCYFSQPAEDGVYEDNPNVLFEAGMMQALTASANALMRGWIPIRDKASTSPPFDVASERILAIERTDDGALPPGFADELRARIDTLVASLKGIG